MTIRGRVDDLERRHGGRELVRFVIVAHGLVKYPDGTTQTIEEYEREHPDWRDTAFTITFSRPGDDLVPDEDDEELGESSAHSARGPLSWVDVRAPGDRVGVASCRSAGGRDADLHDAIGKSLSGNIDRARPAVARSLPADNQARRQA